MAQGEPGWWYCDAPQNEPQWQRTVLQPAASLYGAVAQFQYSRVKPYRAKFPVICVGNFTAGGTGKTPMSLFVADLVEAAGGAPWFLSRGYGGRLDGQERVDPARHTAAEVGDEPLLLAARAPTVISRDRRLGAEFLARRAPANAVIIMDDGLLNPALAKDLRIAIVDGRRGFGNGAVIPAGPLRAPLAFQLGLADIIVINGRPGSTAMCRAQLHLADAPQASAMPQLSAIPVPRGNTAWLEGLKVAAYAGIADPARFFDLLEKLGATVIERVAFADHQSLSNEDAEKLLSHAAKNGAALITTEKDYVRLGGLDRARLELRAKSKMLPITLQMPDNDRAALLARVVAAVSGRAAR